MAKRQVSASQRRSIPSVGRLIDSDEGRALCVIFGREIVVDAIRKTLEARRSAAADGSASPEERPWPEIQRRLHGLAGATLTPVLNATGIAIHTNLGRAPLAAAAVEAINAAAGYSTLELDAATGKRGDRRRHVEPLLCAITGAEASLMTGNCAGAVLLALTALCAGRPVCTSRGELVEIGGGFRVHEVISASGAGLMEIGSTNRTRLSDYTEALDRGAGLILRTHPSNFRMTGFTGRPTTRELADLARRYGIPLIEDLGSGALIPPPAGAGPGERTVGQSLDDGADIVLFSGDKLLGGPQAGLAVGRADLIRRMSYHPLARALRSDKLTIAAMAATLRLYLQPEPHLSIPALRMIYEDIDSVRERAQAICAALSHIPGIRSDIVASTGYAGGGALPMAPLEGWAASVVVNDLSANELARRLRSGDPPVIARIAEDRVLVEARTLCDSDLPPLIALLGSIARTCA